MLLESWSLTFTGLEVVPEPGEATLAAGALLVGFALWRRQRR
jgi:MYXO-CTERM domain-containing protein